MSSASTYLLSASCSIVTNTRKHFPFVFSPCSLDQPRLLFAPQAAFHLRRIQSASLLHTRNPSKCEKHHLASSLDSGPRWVRRRETPYDYAHARLSTNRAAASFPLVSLTNRNPLSCQCICTQHGIPGRPPRRDSCRHCRQSGLATSQDLRIPDRAS